MHRATRCNAQMLKGNNREKAERGLGRQSTQEPLIGFQQQFKCSPKADGQAATAAVADIPSDSLFSCVPIKRLIVTMPFPFAVDLANFSITRNFQDDPLAALNKGTELNLDEPDSRASRVDSFPHSSERSKLRSYNLSGFCNKFDTKVMAVARAFYMTGSPDYDEAFRAKKIELRTAAVYSDAVIM